jgi:hypothetical protein
MDQSLVLKGEYGAQDWTKTADAIRASLTDPTKTKHYKVMGWTDCTKQACAPLSLPVTEVVAKGVKSGNAQ